MSLCPGDSRLAADAADKVQREQKLPSRVRSENGLPGNKMESFWTAAELLMVSAGNLPRWLKDSWRNYTSTSHPLARTTTQRIQLQQHAASPEYERTRQMMSNEIKTLQ